MRRSSSTPGRAARAARRFTQLPGGPQQLGLPHPGVRLDDDKATLAGDRARDERIRQPELAVTLEETGAACTFRSHPSHPLTRPSAGPIRFAAMPSRLELEAARVRDRVERGDPYWPAQVTVAVAIGLNFLLSDEVTVGPTWLLPVIEAVLLAALVVIAPARATAHSRGQRTFALGVIAFVTLANVVSLALLVHYLVNGGTAGGHRLLLSGTVLWATNVLLFAVWYWEMDRGGPVARFRDPGAVPDLQFPQMTSPPPAAGAWRPGLRRLPLHLAHERDGLQPDRHDAAHPHGQGRHGRSVGRSAAHRRAGRRARGEHPRLTVQRSESSRSCSRHAMPSGVSAHRPSATRTARPSSASDCRLSGVRMSRHLLGGG